MFYIIWVLLFIIVNKIMGWLANSTWYVFGDLEATNFQHIRNFVSVCGLSAIPTLIIYLIYF